MLEEHPKRSQRQLGSELDPEQLETVDTNTDDSARKTAAAQADQSLASDVAALPMDPLPDIAIWNKKVVGPIGDNAIMGMFWNINQWGLQQ